VSSCETSRRTKVQEYALTPSFPLDFSLQEDESPRQMTTTVFISGRSQTVRLPREFRLLGPQVSIRQIGDGVLLEPVKGAEWPPGYFENITIADKAFARPDQGAPPPLPALD